MLEDQLIRCLAEVCHAARESAGVKVEAISAANDAARSTVYAFEGGHWPREPEAMVRGYAQVVGLHPAVLWRRALEKWEAATPPAATPDDAQLEAIREAAYATVTEVLRQSGLLRPEGPEIPDAGHAPENLVKPLRGRVGLPRHIRPKPGDGRLADVDRPARPLVGGRLVK